MPDGHGRLGKRIKYASILSCFLVTLSLITFVCLARTLSALEWSGAALVCPLWAVARQSDGSRWHKGLGFGSLPFLGLVPTPTTPSNRGPLPFTAAAQGQNASLPAIDTIPFHVTLFPFLLGNKYRRYSKCLFLSAAISQGHRLSLSTLLFETVFKVGTDRGEEPLPPTEVFFRFFSSATNQQSSKFMFIHGFAQKGQHGSVLWQPVEAKLLHSQLCCRN